MNSHSPKDRMNSKADGCVHNYDKGDMISYYDDGIINPNSVGYRDCRVIHVPYTKKQLDNFFSSIKAKVRTTVDSRAECEISPSVWINIKKKAQYLINLDHITDEDIQKLKQSNLTLQQKTTLLKSRIRSCIESQIIHLLDDD